MRSLFTDFGYESGYLDEVVEAQLAQSWGALARKRDEGNGQGDEARKAYLRSAFWSHRVATLQHWAATSDAMKAGQPGPMVAIENVVSLESKAA